MKIFNIVLTMSLGLSTVLPAGAYETCRQNYLGNPYLTATCNNYCCGTSDYQYCCSKCSSSLYSSNSCGLSAQTIVGIVLGCVAFVIIVVLLVLVILYVRNKKRNEIHMADSSDKYQNMGMADRPGPSVFDSEPSTSNTSIDVAPPPQPPPSYNYQRSTGRKGEDNFGVAVE